MSNMTRRQLFGAAAGLALILSAGAAKAAGKPSRSSRSTSRRCSSTRSTTAPRRPLTRPASSSSSSTPTISRQPRTPRSRTTSPQKVDGIILVAIDVNGVKPAITRPRMPASRSSPSTRASPTATTPPSSASTTQGAGDDIGKYLRRLREVRHGRFRQDRRRRRAQLLHPEPAPRRLQEGGRPTPAPRSPSSTRSTARTCRTSRSPPPKT